MEISSLSTPPPTPPSKPASSNLRSREAGSASSSAPAAPGRAANLSALQSLQQAMNNLPDTRADVVARGKELVAASTYPAAQIIDRLAEMFVADAEPASTAE